MVLFASALSNHNAYLGYHGNFDEGAASCWKAAGAFGILALASAAVFVASAVRTKFGYGATAVRSDYTTV